MVRSWTVNEAVFYYQQRRERQASRAIQYFRTLVRTKINNPQNAIEPWIWL